MNNDLYGMQKIIQILIKNGLSDEQIKEELLHFYREYPFALKEISSTELMANFDNSLFDARANLEKEENIVSRSRSPKSLIEWVKKFMEDNPKCDNIQILISALVAETSLWQESDDDSKIINAVTRQWSTYHKEEGR